MSVRPIPHGKGFFLFFFLFFQYIVNVANITVYKYTNITILYAGKYLPPPPPPPVSFSPLLALLLACEFKTGRNFHVSNDLSLNTTVSGRIHDGAKLFASVEVRKLHEVKITLYTVYMIHVSDTILYNMLHHHHINI